VYNCKYSVLKVIYVNNNNRLLICWYNSRDDDDDDHDDYDNERMTVSGP